MSTKEINKRLQEKKEKNEIDIEYGFLLVRLYLSKPYRPSTKPEAWTKKGMFDLTIKKER
jgi:hypothetical protein